MLVNGVAPVIAPALGGVILSFATGVWFYHFDCIWITHVRRYFI